MELWRYLPISDLIHWSLANKDRYRLLQEKRVWDYILDRDYCTFDICDPREKYVRYYSHRSFCDPDLNRDDKRELVQRIYAVIKLIYRGSLPDRRELLYTYAYLRFDDDKEIREMQEISTDKLLKKVISRLNGRLYSANLNILGANFEKLATIYLVYDEEGLSKIWDYQNANDIECLSRLTIFDYINIIE